MCVLLKTDKYDKHNIHVNFQKQNSNNASAENLKVRVIHKKIGPEKFSNFMSPGLAESVPGPVVMNGNVYGASGGNPVLQ